MATIAHPVRHWPSGATVEDVIRSLGVPAGRIRLFPGPGTATPDDVEPARTASGRICELFDGVLVEKPVGYLESRLAVVLAYLLETFLDEHDLGIVLGEAGTLRILPEQVRAPDVSFISWEKFPGRKLPREPVPPIVPDLAVEVLSEGNTAAEMARKVRDYFHAGVRLVWIIDPPSRTARAYRAPATFDELAERDSLAGGDVLPGFAVTLGELFARAERKEA